MKARRWWAVVGVAAAVAGAMAILAASGGGFGARIGGTDLYGSFLSKYRYAAETFRAGRFPLWNPFEYCGVPLHGTAQGSVLYPPIVLPNLVLSPLPALQAIYDLHIAALVLFTMLYLVRAGTTLTGAAVGATLATACFFNDPATAGSDHPHFLGAATWVPAMLLAWDAWLAGRVAGAAVIPLCFGLQWLAGYPEFPLDTALLFMIVVLLARGDALARRVGMAALLLALGVLIGAAQIVPLAEAVSQSGRPGQSSFPHWYRTLRTLFAVKGPGHLADMVLERYGAAGVICALVGLATTSRYRVAWAGALVWALFATNRPFVWVYEVFPYSMLRFAFGWHLLHPLFAGCLAAVGIDRLRRGRDWLPTTIAATIALVALARGHVGPAGVAGASAVAVSGPLGHRGGWIVPLVLVGVHAGGVLHGVGGRGFLPAPDLPALKARAVVLRRLHETLPGAPRVISGPEVRAGMMLAGHVPSAGGFEPSAPPGRMWQLSRRLGFDLLWGEHAERQAVVWDKLAANPALAAAAGIGIAVVPPGREGTLLRVGFRQVETLSDGDLVLFRPAPPRFRLVHAATPSTGAADSMRLLSAPDFDPGTTVIVEGEPPGGITSAPGEERVDVVHETPEEIRLTATAASTGMLVVGDTDFPGWEARVDGAAAPILRANFAFRAIALTAGVHDVTLTYRPRSFRLGLAASALGLALTLGVYVGLKGRAGGRAEVRASGRAARGDRRDTRA